MNLLNLLKKTRTHRAFSQKKFDKNLMEHFITGTIYASSSRNSQRLRYISITQGEICNEIFKNIKFAGSIPWNPTNDEAPTGYIALCTEISTNTKDLNLYFDMGLATQNILLLAKEKNISCCIIGAFNKEKLENILEIQGNYNLHYIIALGYAIDIVEITKVKDNDLKYSRKDNHHFVPKLEYDDILIYSK